MAIASTTAPSAGFEAKQIKPSIYPLRPETLAEMHTKNPPRKSHKTRIHEFTYG